MSLRKLSTLSRLYSTYSQLSNLRRMKSNKLKFASSYLLEFKPPQMVICRKLTSSVSDDPSFNVEDYPAEVEVSFEEFKFVEQVLPCSVVPELPEHSSYPTPSGWIPPNDVLRSQQSFLVRRTKNHVLPVYAQQIENWGRMMHHVIIKNIEGDIWKLESELRHHLQDQTGEKKIITQVHEVSRCIRIRGQHRAIIAEFLMERGM